MSRPWFRMYHEFVSDPKVQLLAFEDQRHFVALLCLKCNDTLDSAAPTEAYRDRMIAKALGLSPDAAMEAKRRLLEVGLIDGSWQPVQWDSRQYDSDSSTERTRRYREKLNETSRERHKNVTVTDERRVEESRTDISAAPMTLVFEHWKQVHNHPRARIDAKRIKLITTALKNYSVDDLKLAISGYKNSPHHMGKNERNAVYDDIEIFLRDAKHIDTGIKLASGGAEKWT